MEVGHPVTVPSGAHGIIAAKRQDGVTEVHLLGGSTVRVPHAELKSYFEQPMPEGKIDRARMGIDTRTDCPICHKMFKTNKGVRIHFSKQHPNDPYPFTMNWVENSKQAYRKSKEKKEHDQSSI